MADDTLTALSNLMQAHRGELAALARHEGLSPEDAVDCVHDACCTFLKAPPPAEQALVLKQMVVNAARNQRRRAYVAKPHDDLDVLEDELDRPSAETLLAHAEDCVRLRGCMRKLCKTHRTVVMMRLLDERRGEDVASALGITRGHVDVLLHRAKAALRACMIA